MEILKIFICLLLFIAFGKVFWEIIEHTLIKEIYEHKSNMHNIQEKDYVSRDI